MAAQPNAVCISSTLFCYLLGSGIAEMERKKREREVRKQERQRALAEKRAATASSTTSKPGSSGRAMKLGAKKIAND